jgi:hypothetical protein
MVTPIDTPTAVTGSSKPGYEQDSTPANPLDQQKCILRPLTKTLKDSEMWYTINVPEDWNATTFRERGYGTWEGFYFYSLFGVEVPVYNQTDSTARINSTRFTIMTYAMTRNQDQDYRNYYRDNWNPAPIESIETINGIDFNRFESKGDRTAVVYVVKKTSVNEKGYGMLIWYYVSQSECPEEIEQIVHTFRYISQREMRLGNVTGVDISIPYP